MQRLSFSSPDERAALADEGGELLAPTPALLPSAQALARVRRICTSDRDWEVRFPARDGLAWATAAMVRQDASLRHVRVIVEVGSDDAALAAMPASDAPMAAYLALQAARLALRDAHSVEGDEKSLQRLRDAGLPLAAPMQEPRWAEGERLPQVSAIVTHKDLGQYLPECIASLRAQTVPVEIVLVDDGSGREGLAAVAEEERKDGAIRVVRQHNRGLAGARNGGIEAASGEWVLIVDADNVMRPRMVERLLEAVRCCSDAEFAVPGFRVFDDATGAQEYLYCPSELWAVTLLAENTGGDACALHRRATLRAMGGFRAQFNPVEDWELWLRYAEAGQRGAVVAEVLFDYRLRGDSMMRTLPRHAHVAAPFRLAFAHEALLSPNLETTISLWAGTRIRESVIQGCLQGRAEMQPYIDGLNEQLRAHVAEVDRLREALKVAQEEQEKAAAVTRQTLAALDELSNSTPLRMSRALRSISPGLHGVAGRIARRVLPRK